MRISDWSSDVCSSDLAGQRQQDQQRLERRNRERRTLRQSCATEEHRGDQRRDPEHLRRRSRSRAVDVRLALRAAQAEVVGGVTHAGAEPEPHAPSVLWRQRSEEHTSDLQSLMRIPYVVFCLKKKKNKSNQLAPNTPKPNT